MSVGQSSRCNSQPTNRQKLNTYTKQFDWFDQLTNNEFGVLIVVPGKNKDVLLAVSVVPALLPLNYQLLQFLDDSLWT